MQEEEEGKLFSVPIPIESHRACQEWIFFKKSRKHSTSRTSLSFFIVNTRIYFEYLESAECERRRELISEVLRSSRNSTLICVLNFERI